MNSKAVAMVSVSLLLLLGAFAVPQMIQVTNDPQYQTLVLDVGESREVTEGLNVTLTDSSNTQATVNLTDVETGDETGLVIPEGGSANYSLPGGDGNVTVVETTNQESEIKVAYDPLYNYSDTGRIIIDNIGFILILLMFTGVMGLIAKEAK